MARKKKPITKRYKYTGPKVKVMLLADGAKIVAPNQLAGQRLETLLDRHPQLRNYYALSEEEE